MKKSAAKKIERLPSAKLLPDIERNGAVFVLDANGKVRIIDIFGKVFDEEVTEGAALDNVSMKKLQEALKIVEAAVANKKIASKLPEKKHLVEVGRSLHAQQMSLDMATAA